MPFSTQEADQGKGAKALDDEPEGGDRMSASQERWTIEGMPGSADRLIRVSGPLIPDDTQRRVVLEADYEALAEQLQVAVEENTRLRAAISNAVFRLDTIPVSPRLLIARDALVAALGESQEEMKP